MTVALAYVGIRFFVRHKILRGEEAELRLTDECLFRIMIPKSGIGSDQKLVDFFDQSGINVLGRSAETPGYASCKTRGPPEPRLE